MKGKLPSNEFFNMGVNDSFFKGDGSDNQANMMPEFANPEDILRDLFEQP